MELMRYAALLAVLVLLAGCNAGPAQQADAAELQTIHNTPPRPAQLEQPLLLLDEAPPPKPKALPWEKPVPIVFSPEDERFRGSLPFSPAIAMDPVDGSKISMRSTTPTYEYKGRIYYFSSEANRSTFVASPDQFLTGRFTNL
jgi:YHS domain-containing protein